MTEEQPVTNEPLEPITRGGKRFLFAWVAGVLLLYLFFGLFSFRSLHGYYTEAARIQQAWIDSATTEAKALPALPPGEKPVNVTVGVYLNRLTEFALKEAAFTLDFNLWFRWSGSGIDPGQSFHVANGQMLLREEVERSSNGEEHYEEYHVLARMTQQFDATRFPFGVGGLLVQVEDTSSGAERPRYVIDRRNSNISAQAMPRLIKLTKAVMGISTRGSRVGLAGMEGAGRRPEEHSQFFFAMLVKPAGFSIYLRLFQALFASVAVALIALFIKPIHIDCRFGLPVGGFFASVTNNVFVASLLPQADRMTLSDLINRATLFTIFLVLVQSVISLYVFDTMDRKRLALVFDRVTFWIVAAGFVVINVVLPLSARS